MLSLLAAVFAGCNGSQSIEEENSSREGPKTDPPVDETEEGSLDGTDQEGEETGGDNTVETETPSLTFYQDYSVEGELQTLFSSGDNLWAISRRAGSYGNPESESVYALSSDLALEKVTDLPDPEQRSYQWSLPFQHAGSNYVATLYASTEGYDGQDGTHHGVVVLDDAGNVLADHDLYTTTGNRGPSAVSFDETTGQLYVLMNNMSMTFDEEEVLDFGSSAIVQIPDFLSQTASYSVLTLDGFKNASSMGLRNGKLVVAAANNTLDADKGAAKILVVDPAGQTIDKVIDIPNGVGMNGPAPINQNGDLIFTGNNSQAQSIVLLNGSDQVVARTLPSGYQVYVANAEPVGSSLLFNVTQAGETSTLLLHDDGSSFELNKIEALFGISPVSIGGNTYCDGASGAGIMDDGTLLSSITCYISGE